MAEAGVMQSGTSRNLAEATAALDFFFKQKALRLAEQGQTQQFRRAGGERLLARLG